MKLQKVSHEQTAKSFDKQISKLVRVALTGFYAHLSKKNIEAYRDTFASLAATLDQFLQENPRWKARQPAGDQVAEIVMLLKKYIGHDSEKLQSIAELCDYALAYLEDIPEAVRIPTSEPANASSLEDFSNFRSVIHILFRGVRGRRTDPARTELYEAARKLRDSGHLSYAQVARKMIPEDFAKNPQNATARIKAGIKRLTP